MKVGDLVKYVPALEAETDVHVGVIVAITSQSHRLRRGSDIWYSVLWMGDTDTHGYTEDSLEVINESR